MYVVSSFCPPLQCPPLCSTVRCSQPAARRSEAGGQSAGGLEAGASARVSSKQTLAGWRDICRQPRSLALHRRSEINFRSFSLFITRSFSHTHISTSIYTYLHRTGTFSLAGASLDTTPCCIYMFMCQGLSGVHPTAY